MNNYLNSRCALGNGESWHSSFFVNDPYVSVFRRKFFALMFASWGQSGTMSPMPTRSDRDDSVADNLCLAVAFNVSIVSENCFHRYVIVIAWLGFLWFPVSGFGANVVDAMFRYE